MQTKPDYLDQLICRASAVAGSDYKLAQQLGVTRQNVSNWRHGKQKCPAGDVALMADIAGLDAEAWTARAVIASYGDTSKGKKIAGALKKAFAATGAASVLSGLAAMLIAFSVSFTPRPAEAATSYDV